LQNLETQVIDQIETAINGVYTKLSDVSDQQEDMKADILRTNQLVHKLDEPFKDMREVLIQVTSALSEMDDTVQVANGGGESVKSTLSNAKKKMLESRERTDAS
jgi:ABC-type transporter Mla subunit MlaD